MIVIVKIIIIITVEMEIISVIVVIQIQIVMLRKERKKLNSKIKNIWDSKHTIVQNLGMIIESNYYHI